MANDPVKAIREGYSEKPFFFVEEQGDTPYAVCWLDDLDRLRDVSIAILETWPEKLEVHFEAPVHPQEEDDVFDLFGDITRTRLLGAMREHPEVPFRDGGVRLRIWRKDNQDCLGIDEHGLLFLWAAHYRARATFEKYGVEERTAELINDDDHWHSDPDDAEQSRTAFVAAMGLADSGLA